MSGYRNDNDGDVVKHYSHDNRADPGVGTSIDSTQEARDRNGMRCS